MQMWSNQDKDMLRSMGKMALEMLRRNTDMFFKDNLKEYGLDLREVVMLTGLCTELPAVSNQRRFSFIHFTLQVKCFVSYHVYWSVGHKKVICLKTATKHQLLSAELKSYEVPPDCELKSQF